jgi:hypothetical protein
MTSFRPPESLVCPACGGRFLDDRRPRDPLLPPGRDWSDGWNCARATVPPLGLCAHCRRRFWFDDLRRSTDARSDLGSRFRGTHDGLPRVLQPSAADWLAEVDALEDALRAASPPRRTDAPSLDAPSPGASVFEDEEASPWQRFVGVETPQETARTEAVSLAVDRRVQAAQHWLWIDNHLDRSLRLDARRYRFELEEPEMRERDPGLRCRMLALLIDAALREGSTRARLQAAEYLREGGWFMAACRGLEGFESRREALLEAADQTRMLALLGLHQVVPRIHRAPAS